MQRPTLVRLTTGAELAVLKLAEGPVGTRGLLASAAAPILDTLIEVGCLVTCSSTHGSSAAR